MALLLGSGPLFAAPPAAGSSRSTIATAPAGAGQAALSVGFDASSRLRASSCTRGPCPLEQGVELSLPAEAAALTRSARLTVVPIGEKRRAVHVAIPDPERRRQWEAVIAAPLGAGAPSVPFQGWTGYVEGVWGERHGPMVQVASSTAGAYSILIGQQREDLTLCGRPTILSPRLLTPTDLKLRPAKVQRLDTVERSRALRVTAERLPEDAPRGSYPLLRALIATSAVGNPQALTDGNPATTWAENRGGSGRGEIVLMKVPPELPITGFELVVRPPGDVAVAGTSPREFFLATRSTLIQVSMPEDAWKIPGARWGVRLPQALTSDCVALVTESAYDEGAAAQVTFAELSAQTEFDRTALESLVGALAGGGERSTAAASALSALGEPGFQAIAKAYQRLDEGGRRVALDALDAAPCTISAPIYVKALLSPYRAHRIHAEARLVRCGDPAAQALEAALRAEPRRAHPLFATEIALIAPGRAVRAIAPLLDLRETERRRLLRIALARAMQSEAADGAIRELLAAPGVTPVALVDALRALGDRIGAFRAQAAPALLRLLASEPSFRTRFLLLEPAARLSRSDAGARAFVSKAIQSDADARVRARASDVARDVEVFAHELLRAVDDPEVRVREAGIRSLGEARAAFAATALARRLQSDPWPLVRGASADALGRLGPEVQVDAVLARALGDESDLVRRQSVLALGDRRALSHAPQIRERLDDGEETEGVRAGAATALGNMCDTGSVDRLTKHARKLGDPTLSGPERTVSSAALFALGRVRPRDLEQRLAPLLDPRLPSSIRQAARAALTARTSCVAAGR